MCIIFCRFINNRATGLAKSPPTEYFCGTMRKYDLAVFDLDGTLLNTIGDLAESCNYVMRENSLPQHTLDEYRSFVGNGVKRLVERATPEHLRTSEYVECLRTRFVEYYQQHIDLHTVPYSGIHETLRKLSVDGVRLAVASNKFQAGTAKLISLFFPDVPFSTVFGSREGVPVKPAPDVVFEIMRLNGIAPDRTIYIGDSGVDMQTAAAAGVFSVGCAWGFRSQSELSENGAQAIIHDSSELLRLILG